MLCYLCLEVLTFEQGALHFHFIPGSAIFVTGPSFKGQSLDLALEGQGGVGQGDIGGGGWGRTVMLAHCRA